MKRFYLLLVLFGLSFSFCVKAQNSVEDHLANSEPTSISSDSLKQYYAVSAKMEGENIRLDTTTIWYDKYFGRNYFLSDSVMSFIDYNPDYYRLFVPLTYYYAPMESLSTVDWQMPADSSTLNEIDRSILPYDSLQFTSYKSINKLVNNALLSVYTKDYRLVRTTEDIVMSRKIFRGDISPDIPQRTRVINLFRAQPIGEDVGHASLRTYKPNWWTHGGSFSLQTTQNYVSKNWYQGGESTNTILGYFSLKANYNDKEKIQWDNLLEGKLGITSAPSDTCHKFLVTNNLLRLYSKLGIQASNKWYYTLSGEFNTQISDAYTKNTNTLVAAFLAPANLILSVGMDYKVKTKKLDFSLLLSPFAYNMRYVGNNDVNETNYGLKEGDKFLHIFGSKVTSTWTWQVIPTVSWVSRIYYFTNYKQVEAEWENTFNFKLNQYLSAQLFVHDRFDDSVTPTSGSSYFQLKEYLSFGISYAW